MLYIIRHGSTNLNEMNPPVLQGRSVDSPLSTLGIQQAEKTAAYFVEKGITKIYSSPLRRAIETATIIAKPLNLSIEIADDLIEADLSVWENMTIEQVKQKYATDFAWFSYDTGWRKPGRTGESYNQVLERITPFLETINANGETNLVVSHSVVVKAYMAKLLQIPLWHARELPMSNCSINFYWKDKNLITLNSVQHLI
jgi:broad specificity phosphatase PhoE